MFRVAVCDDEKKILLETEEILQEYGGRLSKICLFESGEALLLAEQEFDVLILDIDMVGMNGIETARKIRDKDKKVRIIYLTNYTDYSLFAYEVHAFAYLLKTTDREKLKKALFSQLDEVFLYLEEQAWEEKEFATVTEVVRIKIKEILYFEYQNRMVKLAASGQEYFLKKRITDVAEEMKEFHFAVPHKSFVVNLYRVRSVKGSDVVMADGTRIPLSQKKASQFRKEMNCYLGSRTGKRENGR